MSFPIRVSIEGDEIEVGFEGSPPQMDRGGSNCTLTYTKAHTTYPLKCILSPEVPGNAGCYRPMRVDAPAKSIMNCDRPLAVNMRTRTGWYIAPNVFGALAEGGLRPGAGVHRPPGERPVLRDRPGRHLLQRSPVPGGRSGCLRSAATGIRALLYPTSAGNTSVELFETRVPALVHGGRRSSADSGGPGRQRGGLGQVISARKLERRRKAVPGRALPHGGSEAGGRPLRRAAGRAAGRDPRPFRRRGPGRRGGSALGARDARGVRGAPRCGRPPGSATRSSVPSRRSSATLAAGLVTRAGAERDYGCVVDVEGVIDRAASERLRAERAGRSTRPSTAPLPETRPVEAD